MQDEHVPMFPRFVGSLSTRLLFFYSLGCMYGENDERVELSDELEDLEAFMFNNNALVFVDDILSLPWLDDLVRHEKHLVSCTKNGRPVAIRIRGKRRMTRWIIQADSWGLTAGREMLQTLRHVFALTGGVANTAGAMGQALMRQTWKEQFGDEWAMHRHSRPNMSASRDIIKNMTGGRVDTPGLGKTYDTLYEIDQRSAYPAHYRKHPTGTSHRIYRSEPGWAVTYFAKCKVTVHNTLTLGPFPVRVQDGEYSYPTYPEQPGTYECWLWFEQVEDCRKLGCTVEIIEGWAWSQWTEDNASWVQLIERLRARAADYSKEVEGVIKLISVAGIGRHAMGEYSYHLVPGDEAKTEDIQVSGNVGNGQGLLYNWFVREVACEQYEGMPHWFAYTVMQCSRTLYWYALPLKEKEWLVATNYDAVYSTQPLEGVLWKQHVSTPQTLGTWLQSELHEVTIPAPRALESREKTRRPGVKRTC